MDTSTGEIAILLSKAVDIDTLASILNGILCADADPKYSDRESQIAQELMSDIIAVCPAALNKATEE